MNAIDIMTASVVTTKGDVKISQVKDLFYKNKINSAPVVDDNGEIEGIITSSDVSAIYNEDLYVRNVMTQRVHVCALNARVVDIAKTMTTERIHHMVVMEDGKIKGMVSSLDVIGGLI